MLNLLDKIKAEVQQKTSAFTISLPEVLNHYLIHSEG